MLPYVCSITICTYKLKCTPAQVCVRTRGNCLIDSGGTPIVLKKTTALTWHFAHLGEASALRLGQCGSRWVVGYSVYPAADAFPFEEKTNAKTRNVRRLAGVPQKPKYQEIEAALPSKRSAASLIGAAADTSCSV